VDLGGARPRAARVFVDMLRRVSETAIAIFGNAPYKDYTYIFVAGRGGGLEHLNSTTIGVTMAVLALGIAAAGLASLWLARRLAKPILLLRDGAQRLGSGDLSAKIDVQSRDEIQSVAIAFNGMADSLRALYALARSHGKGPVLIGHLSKEEAIPKKFLEQILLSLKAAGLVTKSSLMVGVGETDDEVLETMRDLRAAGVDILTLGQYLRPTPKHAPVERYVPPEQFDEYARAGREMGFAFIASGPLVRSSYHAAEGFVEARLRPSEASTSATAAEKRPVFALPEAEAPLLIRPESLVRR